MRRDEAGEPEQEGEGGDDAQQVQAGADLDRQLRGASTTSPEATSPCPIFRATASAWTTRGTTGGKVRVAYPAMVLQLTPSTAAPIGPPTSGTSFVRFTMPFSPAFDTSR